MFTCLDTEDILISKEILLVDGFSLLEVNTVLFPNVNLFIENSHDFNLYKSACLMDSERPRTVSGAVQKEKGLNTEHILNLPKEIREKRN